MKSILDFLLRKEVIMIVAILVVGLLLGKQCRDDRVSEHEKAYLEFVADSLKAEAAKIQKGIDQRDTKIDDLEETIKSKDLEIQTNDSIYNRTYNYYNREIRRYREMAPEEASGVIDSIYHDLPEGERDRAILVDLVRGQQSDSLLNIAAKQIDQLEFKIDLLSEITMHQDTIIQELKRQNEIHQHVAMVASDQVEILEKQLRKAKIWKWFGIGIGAAGVIFGVTR
jgi:hypothetical protein